MTTAPSVIDLVQATPRHHDRTANVALYEGEAYQLMRTMPASCVDVVFADPPYSSGGMMRSDRATRTPSEKYQLRNRKKVLYGEFSGDNRDQRSYLAWSTLWMTEAHRITKPGGVLAVFTDWRQMPVTSDAIQCGGWVWRGLVAWDKTAAVRPHCGRFSAQCEFIAWGSKGPMPQEGPALAGCFRQAVNTKGDRKQHTTGKPVKLMKELLRIAWRPGAVVLDPFCGSGTTLRAAMDLGLAAIGIELEPGYSNTTVDRLHNAQRVLPGMEG